MEEWKVIILFSNSVRVVRVCFTTAGNSQLLGTGIFC